MRVMDLNKGFILNNSTGVLMFFILISVSISGCSDGRVASSGVSSDPYPTPKDVGIPATVNVCNPLDIQDIAFPRQGPVAGIREVMEAELVGDLVLSEGCLRIESMYDNQRYIPIWPPEFTVVLENDSTVILDGDGHLVGRVGKEITMGGGEASDSALLACVRDQMPPTCSGKYWVVGDGVRLNLIFDSDFTIQLAAHAFNLKAEPEITCQFGRRELQSKLSVIW